MGLVTEIGNLPRDRTISSSGVGSQMERIFIQQVVGDLARAGVIEVQLALRSRATEILLHHRDYGRASSIERLLAGFLFGKADDDLISASAADALNLEVVVTGLVDRTSNLGIVDSADELNVNLGAAAEVDAPRNTMPE